MILAIFIYSQTYFLSPNTPNSAVCSVPYFHKLKTVWLKAENTAKKLLGSFLLVSWPLPRHYNQISVHFCAATLA
jgi:hypothetical protein